MTSTSFKKPYGKKGFLLYLCYCTKGKLVYKREGKPIHLKEQIMSNDTCSVTSTLPQ